MGILNSKFDADIPADELLEENAPSTPKLSNKITHVQELDPRSPSLNIVRTPLELLTSSTETLEPRIPIRNKNILLEVDPRSPTTDFERTPIIIGSKISDFRRKLHNKNLDKANLAELIDTQSSSIPPKLLESSPIRVRLDSHKRRSLVGLLETNIDYTETDLDSILQEKYRIEENDQYKHLDDEYIAKEDKIDISTSVDSSKDVLDEMPQIMENINTNFESMQIVSETEAEQDVPVKVEVREAPAGIFTSSSVCHEEIKSQPSKPLINITADVKELDKKLTNLIYEDDFVVCPRIVQLRENMERSPLKNRNGNEFIAKSTQKLKVSDKPRSDYVVSKIPVFKSRKGNAKDQVQCENTPPRHMDKNKAKARKSDWDNKDTTLYL
ncbi:uncharacterized protein LOC130903758 [Diorhabda carinulata]|uniref:uncharacterized protein LOC130903758 n=1 Tax=Diorhabda carinulata TaxID=1163345 RepID=UPI0025A0FAD4|nr:uncharacterized protein LOC130903758 [Diorhabda carinulata]